VAQFTQQELEQLQSYLAQQGVVFQPDVTDATKREVVYAAVNQLTRNPSQVFGYRVDDFNFSRITYHLGYNIATVPAGDYARLLEACNSIPSEFYYDKIIQQIEAEQIQDKKIPAFNPGDTVVVKVKVKEGTSERVQEFKGTVIRKRKGGNNTNFTVRRIASSGIGVERTFLSRSPRIEKVVVHRHAHVRRSKLYFLRERTGKRARLKQKFN